MFLDVSVINQKVQVDFCEILGRVRSLRQNNNPVDFAGDQKV